MFYVLDSYMYDPACVYDDYTAVVCSSLYIMSPGFGSKKLYENNMLCDWLVIAEDDHVLQLTIHTLEIEDSKFCIKDFLGLVYKPPKAGGVMRAIFVVTFLEFFILNISLSCCYM